MYRGGLIILILLAAAGCSHYRGNGGYKTSGDYVTPSNPLPPLAAPPKDYRPRSDFKLFWPVANIRLNRGFKTTTRRPHQGVDLGGSKGAPILAAHEGVVVYAGRDFRGYGNMVLIEYNRQWATLYGHLTKINVREGKIVLPGDAIGTMGRTGRASGVHLHFELMKDRQPVDPLPYLSQTGQVAGR